MMEEVIRELVRVGIVTAVYPERGTVRVTMSDVDDLQTYELQVVVPKTHKDKEFWMPDVGEQVVCLFSGQGLERGWVLGAVYSQADTVPEASRDKWIKRFEDGTIIEYDRKEHHLKIFVRGDITIEAEGNIVIKGARIDLNP